MIFYTWDYLDYVRARKTGFSEFETVGRKKFGGEFPKCPSCDAKVGALEWQPPFIVETTTDKFGDLCTDGQDLLLSDAFHNAWMASGLSCLTYADDRVDLVSSQPNVPNYTVVHIPNTITRLDESASGLVPSNVVGCDLCRVAAREKLDRIRVDMESWTGVDAFKPSGLYGVVLVTSQFVKMVNDAGLTNFYFVHQDDYREPKVFKNH